MNLYCGFRIKTILTLVLTFCGTFVSIASSAEDATTSHSMTAGTVDMTTPDHLMDEHGDHGKTPSGVYGVDMIGEGKFMLSYTPMFMHMEDNYIGSSEVSPQTIATTIPSMMMMGGKRVNYRIVPTSMDTQAHMFHAMYGVTDWLDVMIMGEYLHKSMDMTSYKGAMGTNVLGASKGTSEGVGDTDFVSLWRVYKDQSNEVHLNLGVSLPTGSTTKSTTMLSPMTGMNMTMRASYGMQLGTGTYDILPGLTYIGHQNEWSWGATWRGRFAVDDNDQGYHYGYLDEFNGWGGYTWVPGVTTTARITESLQGKIHGSDPMISGLMQGTNPNFFGGKHTDLLGGVEIASPFGLKNTHLSFEAGGTVYQDLNGPQLGRSWQANAALGIGF